MKLMRFSLMVLLALLLATPLPANNTAESARRLLVLGDSLAAGYGLAADESFPAQLGKALGDAGQNVVVINAGVSGDTTAGGLSRLDWALQDHPHLVILELGANDALRGLPAQQSYDNLDAILSRLGKEGVGVLLAGMRAPRNLGPEYAEAFDRIYPQLADKHGIALYPFFLEGVALDLALNQADGIHPNADGVKVIVEQTLPYVLTELARLFP